MDELTAELWAKQDRHDGDRLRLFRAIDAAVDVESVLYPGSYVDVAPSMVFNSVTYVDMDKRFPKFFGDEAGVREIVSEHREDDDFEIQSVHGDYAADLPLEDESVDLLISLYAGFISEACTRYLRIGGTLLVNPSHGDAALASIDDRYDLSGVILSRDSTYKFSNAALDSYFVPKKDVPVTTERIHELGRGIAYTKSAFAYLFTRSS